MQDVEILHRIFHGMDLFWPRSCEMNDRLAAEENGTDKRGNQMGNHEAKILIAAKRARKAFAERLRVTFSDAYPYRTVDERWIKTSAGDTRLLVYRPLKTAGATPVFVDCTPDTWEIDPDKIEEKITEKTKAIIGVHLYGQPFEFNKVKEIADRHHLYVVEDCAQGHDALYEGKMVGTLGDLGCFSFYPGKNLYAFGEGGSVTGYRKEYFDTIEMMKNQGCTVRYYHDMIGYNYRLEGIQGAVLSVSLKYLPEWTARRREIGWRYTKEITNPAITLQHHPENTNPVFHMFEVEVEDDPERFLAYMAEKGIECNRHYPVPCHLQNAYKHLGYQVGDCPNAEYLASHCATLPLFPEMTDEEVEMVIRACNAYQTA